jgi:hypothetical protein
MAATDTPEARLDTGIAVAIGEVLAARNLTLAGGFMPLSFGDSDLLENVRVAAHACRERGYEPAFHHHHVHMKDADMDAVDAFVQQREPVEELWQQQVFTPLGEARSGRQPRVSEAARPVMAVRR